ncbi:hypothetical protein MNB_SV-13-1305 [hydrothermal vent metagenome]|uniref:Uncharacterized protein n=1 Tax=hydrothermal vent metagenome TaxID=652676 RepID=A0A1W1CE84_9ZZZZ
MKKQLMIISTLALLLNGNAMADTNLEKCFRDIGMEILRMNINR